MATQDNSIIPITSHIVSGLEEQCVNARDLHHFLDVGRDFSSWMKNRIEEYQFVDGQDFIVCSPKRGSKQRGGSNRLDYFLTLEMGKELSMIENNDKGRKVRRYFIECERRAKQPRVDPEFLMIHKSVLRDTGKALVWMGDYGVTSQPYYGGAQPPFIEGRPAMLGDNSTRYYLAKYIGNVMENQHLATEEVITNHLRGNFPALEVITKSALHSNIMLIVNDLMKIAGMVSSQADASAQMDAYLARQGGAA